MKALTVKSGILPSSLNRTAEAIIQISLSRALKAGVKIPNLPPVGVLREASFAPIAPLLPVALASV